MKSHEKGALYQLVEGGALEEAEHIIRSVIDDARGIERVELFEPGVHHSTRHCKSL